jgi:hypothetical protein
LKSPIIAYHQDDEQHWVAELACGHNQHVRHNPPWINRPWVTSLTGRQSTIGVLLECVKCDRHEDSDKQHSTSETTFA